MALFWQEIQGYRSTAAMMSSAREAAPARESKRKMSFI
jgi:hypothetical protein